MNKAKRIKFKLVLLAVVMGMVMLMPSNSLFFNTTYGASVLVSDITKWTSVGGTVTATDNGYEISRGGNSFAVSDKKASEFTFSADITILDGDRATLAYGLSSETNPGQIWRGVEIQKKNDTEGQIKAFIADGPETVAAVQLTGMNWAQPNNVKVELDSSKNLKVYVNNELVGTGSDSTFESGYMGLLTFESKGLFNNIKYTGSLATGNAVSNITSWNSIGGTMTNGADGYVLAENRHGDNFAVSDKNATSFTFDTEVKILEGEGQRASIIYGLSSQKELGVWRGCELMKTSDSEGQVKVFNTGGGDVIPATKITGIDWTKPVRFKLTMDDAKKAIVYINGDKVAEGTDGSYAGGHVGVLSWRTKAIFNNINFLGQAVVSNFYTTLNDLTGLGGTWTEMADGLRSSGNGDNFALSATTAREFTFEANATFGQSKGAASLIFLSSDNPSQNSYCANIDLGAKNARIFKFGGGTLGEFKLPESMQNKTSYKLKIGVIGNSINYFIDDVLVISITDNNLNNIETGKLGLLTFDTTVTYQNVNHVILTDANKPTVTNIAVTGATLAPTYDKNVNNYTAKVPTESTTIEVNATAGEGSTLSISAFDGVGAQVGETVAGGEASIPFTTDEVKIVVTATKSSVSASYVVTATRQADMSTLYNEKYRPQLHFSPLKNWLNDPNGLVYDPSNKTYHMFYQYNPFGLNIGNQVWAHAESIDLINWKQIDEIAIGQDDGLGAIFSGSAVVDENNTSGLFTDNKPGESKLVALFTHDGGDTSKGYEKQSLAYSKDHGHTWIKPSLAKEGFQNPVISNENNKYGRDFRDPKVFWHDDQWMMVVAGGRARLFTSDNLIDWEEVADFGFDSECPDLFPLPVDGDSNNTKWVYTASGDWYIIGSLEKDKIVDGVQKYKFTPETERLPYNGGPEVYATQSYYNDGTNLNRRMSTSWLQDNTAAQIGEGKVWNGAMTLPHELKIKTIDGKLRLTAYPIKEINNQRSATPIYTATQKAVDADDTNILAGVTGEKYDIEAIITPGTATEFGFKLRKGVGQETIVKYDLNAKKFILDRNNAGKVMGGLHAMDMSPMADGKIKIRIIADTSIIEAFGNDGEAPISVYYYPEPTSIGLEFFTNGTVTIDSLNIYNMKSIWHGDFTSEPTEPTIYLSTPSTNVVAGKEVTIQANVLPSNLANKKIKWSVADKAIFEIITESDSSITLKAVKNGNTDVTATLDGTNVKKTISFKVSEAVFKTNLTGWHGVTGTWNENEKGYYTDGISGDAFAFSDISRTTFVYSADATPRANGGCAGLVFGATNPYAPTSGTWFGANIDTNAAGDAVAKLFENSFNSEGWNITKNIPKSADGTYHLKVEVSETGLIKYWVNDIFVGEKQRSNFEGGFLGLVSWNSSGAYNNVMFESPEEPGSTETPTEKPGSTDEPKNPITSDKFALALLLALIGITTVAAVLIAVKKQELKNK